MSASDDFDARLRAVMQGEPGIADDGFTHRVAAGIAALRPARATRRTAQVMDLGAIPLLIASMVLSGLMTTSLLETLLTMMLLTGCHALIWVGTASDLPHFDVLRGRPPL